MRLSIRTESIIEEKSTNDFICFHSLTHSSGCCNFSLALLMSLKHTHILPIAYLMKCIPYTMKCAAIFLIQLTLCNIVYIYIYILHSALTYNVWAELWEQITLPWSPFQIWVRFTFDRWNVNWWHDDSLFNSSVGAIKNNENCRQHNSAYTFKHAVNEIEIANRWNGWTESTKEEECDAEFSALLFSYIYWLLYCAFAWKWWSRWEF